MNKRGQYIVVEGMDGAGKTTVIDAIVTELELNGVPVQKMRDPGYTAISEEIREMVKRPRSEPVDPITELLLFVAACNDSYVRTKALLDTGVTIVSDRSAISTYCYQGVGRGHCEEVAKLHDIVFGDHIPYDHGIFLLVDPKVGLERSRARGEPDRLEQEPFEFFTRVSDAYKDVKMHNWYCKEALYLQVSDMSVEEVSDKVRNYIQDAVKV